MITTNKTLARDLGMYASEIKDGVYYVTEDAPMVSEEKTSFIGNLKVNFAKLVEILTSKSVRKNNFDLEAFYREESFVVRSSNDLEEKYIRSAR